MRCLILSLILGVASLGLLAVSPSQAEAQFVRRSRPAYSYYYDPGYTYSYSYAYPTYSYYWGPTYSPGYYSYYYYQYYYNSYYSDEPENGKRSVRKMLSAQGRKRDEEI